MSCLLVNWLSARATLGVMGFFMFLVTQMIRVNLYIALIAFNDELKKNGTDNDLHQRTWNENSFSIILGAFYWSYWVTELPGGLLAQSFGGKRIMGFGVTLAAVTNFLLPLACKHHYIVASLLRAVQGLALGVTWPVMHWLSGRWIPHAERSKFMSSYHGAAIGSAIAYPLSGFIITSYGWEFVFYFTGLLTLMWCFAWWILVFDSPKQHPRLTDDESKYLAEAIRDTVPSGKNVALQVMFGIFGVANSHSGISNAFIIYIDVFKGDLKSIKLYIVHHLNLINKPKTPWREIIFSKSFWAVLVASQGLMWGTITLSMQTPAYFYQVHHLNIEAAGLLSGIPEISKFLFALIFSTAIDKMISKNLISVTAARKISVAISEYLPANFLILLGLFGYNSIVLATAFVTLTSMVGGGSSSGSLANIVDLSPNHAGTLLGIIKTLTIIPGVLSPIIVSYFMSTPQTKVEQWRTTFFFIAAIYIVCGTVFLIFGSGKVQPWNKIRGKLQEDTKFLEVNTDNEKNNTETKLLPDKNLKAVIKTEL